MLSVVVLYSSAIYSIYTRADPTTSSTTSPTTGPTTGPTHGSYPRVLPTGPTTGPCQDNGSYPRVLPNLGRVLFFKKTRGSGPIFCRGSDPRPPYGNL